MVKTNRTRGKAGTNCKSTPQALGPTDELASMLMKCVEICSENGRRGTHEAFSELVSYLGKLLELNPNSLELSSETIAKLQQALDVTRLQATVGDHLGSLFTRLELADARLGQNFTPTQVVDFMLSMTGVSELQKGQRILDPACGTGVFLVLAIPKIKPGVELYGIEIDRLLYRACMVQLALYTRKGKINPFFVANCDALLNYPTPWEKANLWNGLPGNVT